MEFCPLAIPEIILVTPKQLIDDRGFFEETWNQKLWEKSGITGNFVQDNRSLSTHAFTVRGLHFQTPPHAQAKLVRVSKGKILDVAVDIRVGSPSFGQHVFVILDAKTAQQLWIPAGFAHGFCTLEPDTEVQYKVTDFYSHENDAGIKWNDPALNIDWHIPKGSTASVSKKDEKSPLLADIPTSFQFGEF
ncbi:MAG: dTDP-4-dehydrorhamnose 3,5-epimerase [Robiginitomaculum sp.]|nr:dTDP-4-dehydrorhamnose 3,5-epimerase [Robiginitomaculum sp.]